MTNLTELDSPHSFGIANVFNATVLEYIGKTKRVLSERLYSHKSLPVSAVFQHTKSTGHHVDFAKVQVIDRAETDYKLRLIELQHIIKEKPELNKQLNSKQEEFECKTLIIAAHPDRKQQT